jgi:DNA adenine methylase
MRYLGGKSRLAKPIAEILESLRPIGAPFFDPFCGGLNVTAAMTGERHANDIVRPLIVLYQEWIRGWRPPPIDEEGYQWIKAIRDPNDPITAFAGFGLAFGGQYFSGYAKSRVWIGRSEHVPESRSRRSTSKSWTFQTDR